VAIIVEEAVGGRQEVYKNSLSFLINFSVNLKEF
jgi:hypothetical protein